MLVDDSVDAQARKREGWCRGASGIGLSRRALLADGPWGMATLDATTAAALRDELELAERVAALRAFGGDQCLCHGAMGAVELLAGGYLGGVVEAGVARRWVTGLPASVPDPGLMTGLAGIGFGLLRAVDPAAVPLVLNLALPEVPASTHQSLRQAAGPD
jgi:lantibiotic modifying enzyme